ncbi:MAG: hypothetical protein F9B45_22160 [Phycisphaera sp. RhM]|nr:hypothetical protein [Phycisphaera sp. RhM]
MNKDELQQLVDLLDSEIDRLTKPLPSRQILRLAQAVRSATIGDWDSVGSFGAKDYANLIDAQEIMSELLPPILESIRVTSIDAENGWRFDSVSNTNGDHGLCSICRKPFQHLIKTVKVCAIDMRAGTFRGVCRPCVRQFAPLRFVERDDVHEWLGQNTSTCETMETDKQSERQRIGLIDSIRERISNSSYFGKISRLAPKWAEGAFCEWR